MLLEEHKRQLNQRRQVRLKTCADVYEHWRTCKRLYRKAPSDGVEFQIDYIDTGLALADEARAAAPLVLALHGAPGSYHDFALLIGHLAKQGVRVIAPNFPEYTATIKTNVLFRHSADEKAAYLRDFLRAINVHRVDLLVSHSSAIFPTLIMLLNSNNQALTPSKAHTDPQDGQGIAIADQLPATTALIGASVGGRALTQSQPGEAPDSSNSTTSNRSAGNNATEQPERKASLDSHPTPGQVGAPVGPKPNVPRLTMKRIRGLGSKRNTSEVVCKFEQAIEIRAVALLNPAGHRLPRSMKPSWFKCGAVHCYQHKLGRSLFRKFGPAFLTLVGVPVRVDNMDNVMLSATVMRNSKCHRLIQQLDQLSQFKIPTLFVFSENDKLIEREIFYEMTQFMHLDPKTFDTFNHEGKIELAQSSVDDWIRVMVFKAGGHYAYSNYSKIVNQAVSQLLTKVASAN